MTIRRWLICLMMIGALLLPLTACGEGPGDAEGAVDPAASSEMDMGDGQDGDASMEMAGTAPGSGGPILSGNNRFELRYEAETDPIMVNTMHSWVVNLRTLDGEPVENARLTVDGDMPAHGHGLPTSPEVTEELGGGDYRIEGLKFQMGGYWEVYVDVVTADGEADSVIVPVDIQ